VLELRDGTRKNWQALFIHTGLHKTNTKWLVHSWSTFGTRTSREQLDTQDSPQPRLGGSHHLPPYSILCAFPWGPRPIGFLSRVAVPKLPRLGLPQLWGAITLRANLGWRWGPKQSCSPCWELSNGMSHAIWTQENSVDSWLLVVRSQIGILFLEW